MNTTKQVAHTQEARNLIKAYQRAKISVEHANFDLACAKEAFERATYRCEDGCKCDVCSFYHG